MKVLFLPILTIPMGHHTVADALIRSIQKRRPDVLCKKMDLFSYGSKNFERFLRGAYLRWIRRSPASYGKIYLKTMHDTKRGKFYRVLKLFVPTMRRLLEEEKPDLIVCTSSIPSHVLEILKSTGYETVPIVNVYTDFWLNNLWGLKYSDHHLVPDASFKRYLLKQGIKDPRNVYVTGIPVDECFLSPKDRESLGNNREILVSGGSMGLVSARKVVERIEFMSDHGYSVNALCGRNKKLYENISHSNKNVEPIPYIHSSDAMNALYERCGAMITKPGGVTMSECLHKRLPTFIHGALPGQEEINRTYLQDKGLVFTLDWDQSFIQQLDDFFLNKEGMQQWRDRVDAYLSEIEVMPWEPLLKIMDSLDEK